MLSEDFFGGFRIVEGDEDGVGSDRFGNAGAAGVAVGGCAGSGFDEHRIGMAVVAAGALDDQVAFGAPRARRTADMVASVPELTKRTIGTLGMALAMAAASLISVSEQQP